MPLLEKGWGALGWTRIGMRGPTENRPGAAVRVCCSIPLQYFSAAALIVRAGRAHRAASACVLATRAASPRHSGPSQSPPTHPVVNCAGENRRARQPLWEFIRQVKERVSWEGRIVTGMQLGQWPSHKPHTVSPLILSF